MIQPATLGEYVRRVRLSDRPAARAAAHLARTLSEERRSTLRFPLPTRFPVHLQIEREDGELVFVRVSPRDLSAGGMGVLVRDPVPVGAACAITLRSLDGSPESVGGSVVHCHPLRARACLVGVAFDAPLTVARFVPVGEGAVPETLHAEALREAGRLARLAVARVPRHAMLEQAERIVRLLKGPSGGASGR